MNRIGNLQAEVDSLVSEAKMELEIKSAELGEYYRKSLTKYTTITGKDEKKVSLPTIAEVENSILLDLIIFIGKNVTLPKLFFFK